MMALARSDPVVGRRRGKRKKQDVRRLQKPKAHRLWPEYKAARAMGCGAASAYGAAKAALIAAPKVFPYGNEDQHTLPNGCYLTCSITRDDNQDEPWKNMSCHGEPVTHTGANDVAGHVKLTTGGGRDEWWYYPQRDALAAAREEMRKFGAKHMGRAQIEDAAQHNVQWERDYFRRWLTDEWTFLVVDVKLFYPDGEEISSECIGGVDDEKYALELANEYAEQLLADAPEIVTQLGDEDAEM